MIEVKSFVNSSPEESRRHFEWLELVLGFLDVWISGLEMDAEDSWNDSEKKRLNKLMTKSKNSKKTLDTLRPSLL